MDVMEGEENVIGVECVISDMREEVFQGMER